MQGDGEDDDDAEAIPSCWLPYESGAPGPGGLGHGGQSKKSPLLIRGTSTPPKIIKASLKSFSGLEVGARNMIKVGRPEWDDFKILGTFYGAGNTCTWFGEVCCSLPLLPSAFRNHIQVLFPSPVVCQFVCMFKVSPYQMLTVSDLHNTGCNQ